MQKQAFTITTAAAAIAALGNNKEAKAAALTLAVAAVECAALNVLLHNNKDMFLAMLTATKVKAKADGSYPETVAGQRAGFIHAALSEACRLLPDVRPSLKGKPSKEEADKGATVAATIAEGFRTAMDTAAAARADKAKATAEARALKKTAEAGGAVATANGEGTGTGTAPAADTITVNAEQVITLMEAGSGAALAFAEEIAAALYRIKAVAALTDRKAA